MSARFLRLTTLFVAASFVCSWPGPAHPSEAPSLAPASVLLIVNHQSDDSVKIGEHFARARGLADEQVVRLAVDPVDEVSRAVYERGIEGPIAQHIARYRLHDRVLVLVLTKGVPLRVAGTRGREGTVASVDSELTLLYRKMLGASVVPSGRVGNPYFLGDRPLAEARRFTREAHDIYLVTRLDGFTAGDAMALVDRAREARTGGRVVLDHRAAIDDPGNRWLDEAAARLEAMGWGDRLIVERTSRIVTEPQDVLMYYAWGSGDAARKTRATGLGFVPGAIAATYTATDGRTFTAPPDGWELGTWAQSSTHYAGSPEALAGDLVREGVTGVSAHVADPFLDGTVRPQVLLPAYAAGFSLVEAYYLAIPFLSWQTVVVGDPLVAPFPWRSGEAEPAARVESPAGGRQPPAGVEPPAAGRQPPADEYDLATELPRHFAARRLAMPDAARFTRQAFELALRGESRLARGDEAGGHAALEEAVALDPRLFLAQLLLAARDERESRWEAAAARYQAIVDLDARQVVALNNLAYLLAERLARPGDALPLARRAHTLSGGAAAVTDTLAWVYYRLGDVAQASRYIGEAVRGAPASGEIRLHAAAIALAGGQIELAERELAEALTLDPSLADTPLAATIRNDLATRRR
ncbi:MAG: TIGR03790 family protein [Acidobacteria bacterium]|nr:TIGR03790 family protein [Acidobacteriota bacterium]